LYLSGSPIGEITQGQLAIKGNTSNPVHAQASAMAMRDLPLSERPK
jgi:hypothetical protein